MQHDESRLTAGERYALWLAVILILAAAAVTAVLLIKFKPASKRKPYVPGAPAVTVMKAKTVDHQVVIDVWGTVKPAKEITLQSQVSGKVLSIHKEFMPGGRVNKGDVLVRIDPRDYRLALASAQAKLESAQLNLTVEQGQQKVAQRELAIMNADDSMSDADKELALRKPQLRNTQAAYDAARADVDKAKLNVSRTRMKAPFNAMVRSTGVNQGDLVGQQTQVATLVGTDAYWLEALVPVETLARVDLSRADDPAFHNVTVTTTSGTERKGRVLKVLGDLEASGRMARIICEIPDPLGDMTGGVPDLLLGDYISMQISGKTLSGVVPVSVAAFRDNNTLWLVDVNGRLDIKPVELIWREQKSVYLRGIQDGALIITSALAAPVQGMEVLLPGQKPKVRGPGAGNAGAAK